MKLLRVLPYARQLIKDTAFPGETVVDATAGNGHDTHFLAELVGNEGHVYAFDIQQKALESTAEHLGDLTSRVSLILDSHEHIDKYIHNEIGGALFNLGYLPYGADLSIVTKPASTIAAIHKTLGLLRKDAMIAISVYDGHEGGSEERDELLDYVTRLHQSEVHVARYELINVRKNPPFVIAIEKLRDFSVPRLAKSE